MAGHSKRANIRFRKGVQDAKSGMLFTKLIREITVSARSAGSDYVSNPRLSTAIDKALGQNMTRDTIDRAVKPGSGEATAENYEAIVDEGYHGGNLGAYSLVAFLFNKVGMITFPHGSAKEKILEGARQTAAEDFLDDV
ncbi:MAG TPA: hypothetical protein VIM41_01715 [Gammaproteobacteria bacterium]